MEPILDIDLGECAAISLTQEINADLLLIDDLDGRQAALERGIAIAGTLGILKFGADKSLLDLPATISVLQKYGFRVSDEVLQQILGTQES